MTDLQGYELSSDAWLVRITQSSTGGVQPSRSLISTLAPQVLPLESPRAWPLGVTHRRRPSLSSSSSRLSSSRPRPVRLLTELNLITAKQLERYHRESLIEFACLVYPQLVAGGGVPESAIHSVVYRDRNPATPATPHPTPRCPWVPSVTVVTRWVRVVPLPTATARPARVSVSRREHFL